MKKIILIGGGGDCKSVIDVIEQEKKYKIHGIVDKPKFLGSKILGYKVIGSDLDLEYLAKKYKNAILFKSFFWGIACTVSMATRKSSSEEKQKNNQPMQ